MHEEQKALPQMITVACYLWFDPDGKNNDLYVYGPSHVRTLKRMVERHLSAPHRFICITDRPARDLDGVETVPLDKTNHLPGTRFVKLMTFRPDAAEIIGERILQLDLDTVITGDLAPLIDRPEALVLWRNPNFGVPRRARYNTSIVLLRAGSRPEFWTKFDKNKHPAMLKRNWGGTDQAWVSHLASPEEAHWTAADGVYGAGRLHDIAPGVGTELPGNARVVFFPGRREPGMPETQARHPWIGAHQA
jgi:hypothetical protein